MPKISVLEKTAIFFSVASVAVVFGIAIAGVTLVQRTFYKASQKIPQRVACTEEAKQCPDGSYVGRTAPNCEFAACPVFADVESGSFADISRACSIDSDCVVADSTATYGTCCPTGCGGQGNYGETKWEAVNSDALLKYILGKRPGRCDMTNCPLPMCPPSPEAVYRARCIENTCKMLLNGEHFVGFQILAGSGNGREENTRQVVAKTQAEAITMWSEMLYADSQQEPIQLGQLDFSKEMVVGVSMGMKATGGYKIEVASIIDLPSKLVVNSMNSYPGVGCPVTEAITRPFQIVSLPRTNKPVEFHFQELHAEACR